MNYIVGLGIIVITVFFIWYQVQQSKKAKAQRDAATATLNAQEAAAWAIDYHNPASPNYDPARVAAEQAAQQPVEE